MLHSQFRQPLFDAAAARLGIVRCLTKRLIAKKTSEILTRSSASKRLGALFNESVQPFKVAKLQQQAEATPQSEASSKELDGFIQSWQQTFDKKNLQNEIKVCTHELTKQHNLAQKLIDLHKQLQNLLKSSTEQRSRDLDLILEAINGELQNLQISTSTSASPTSSAQIVANFLSSLSKSLASYKDPAQMFEQFNEAKAKQEEIVKKLKADNKSLRETAKEKKQNGGGDSELIRHLSAKVSKTLAMNSSLNSKLKVAQSEIESLKKLVITFRNGGSTVTSPTAAPAFKKTLTAKKRLTSKLKSRLDVDLDDDEASSLGSILNDDDDDEDYEISDDEEEEDDDVESLEQKTTTPIFDNDEENHRTERETACDEDENINYYSYFNSLNEVGFGGEAPAAAVQPQPLQRPHQQLSSENVADFVSKFYSRATNTIFALPEYINTEDVVLKMREFMQKFKINQRDVGERVIGVKKSHVSFLLSNLKTWDMLTRKGKEPYTRMFLFFYDTPDDGLDNIKKYFNQTYQLPKIDLSGSQKAIPGARVPLSTPQQQQPQRLSSTTLDLDNTNGDIDLSELEHIIIPYDVTSVAESESFDTTELTERVKDLLKTNKVSQELFCRAVLNLSDRILCKPKEWSSLGKKAREHYIRIHLFVNDPFGFEKLNDWKEKHFNEKKWKPKKRRSNVNANNRGANDHESETAAEVILDSDDSSNEHDAAATTTTLVTVAQMNGSDGDLKSEF